MHVLANKRRLRWLVNFSGWNLPHRIGIRTFSSLYAAAWNNNLRWLHVPATTFVITHSLSRSNRREGEPEARAEFVPQFSSFHGRPRVRLSRLAYVIQSDVAPRLSAPEHPFSIRIRTCNQTVMSGRIKVSFLDIIAFSLELDRVRCVLASSFLVRNWCGARLVVGLNELRPYGPNIEVSSDRRGCRTTAQLAPSGSFPNLLGPVSRP